MNKKICKTFNNFPIKILSDNIQETIFIYLKTTKFTKYNKIQKGAIVWNILQFSEYDITVIQEFQRIMKFSENGCEQNKTKNRHD